MSQVELEHDRQENVNANWGKTILTKLRRHSSKRFLTADKKRYTDGSSLHLGYSKSWMPEVGFCTGSAYEGEWNVIGFQGQGKFRYPSYTEYEGNMCQGTFHETGTLRFPMGHRVEGTWDKGKLVSWKIILADGLECDDPWKYCIKPDRRFFPSIKQGFMPSSRNSMENLRPPRKIPEGCYDTGDGFYNPNTKCVMSAIKENKILRVPTTKEAAWIQVNCRKAWDEPTGLRPDLYEFWTGGKREDVEFICSTGENTYSDTSMHSDTFSTIISND